MIKSCWVAPNHESDLNGIAIRQTMGSPKIHCIQYELPPIEEIDGKRLSIDEARSRGLIEKHTLIRFMSTGDIATLHQALGEFLEREAMREVSSHVF